MRQAIAENPNVCKQLHMPAQSGSTTVLARMRRGYTRDAYDALLQRVYDHLPQARSSSLETGELAGAWSEGGCCTWTCCSAT